MQTRVHVTLHTTNALSSPRERVTACEARFTPQTDQRKCSHAPCLVVCTDIQRHIWMCTIALAYRQSLVLSQLLCGCLQGSGHTLKCRQRAVHPLLHALQVVIHRSCNTHITACSAQASAEE